MCALAAWPTSAKVGFENFGGRLRQTGDIPTNAEGGYMSLFTSEEKLQGFGPFPEENCCQLVKMR